MQLFSHLGVILIHELVQGPAPGTPIAANENQDAPPAVGRILNGKFQIRFGIMALDIILGIIRQVMDGPRLTTGQRRDTPGYQQKRRQPTRKAPIELHHPHPLSPPFIVSEILSIGRRIEITYPIFRCTALFIGKPFRLSQLSMLHTACRQRAVSHGFRVVETGCRERREEYRHPPYKASAPPEKKPHVRCKNMPTNRNPSPSLFSGQNKPSVFIRVHP